jgi:hypothetical protein
MNTPTFSTSQLGTGMTHFGYFKGISLKLYNTADANKLIVNLFYPTNYTQEHQ